MYQFMIDRRQVEGRTPEDVVKKLREMWMWIPLPSIEEMYRAVGVIVDREISTAEDYLDTLQELGILKPIYVEQKS